MATRVYLPSSGAPAVTPSTWNFPYQVASPLTYKGVLTTPSNTALTTKLDTTGTTSDRRYAMLRWVIGPLNAQSIAGTVTGILSCMESNAGANANLAIAIKLIQPDGSDRSVLLAAVSSDSVSAPYELTVSPMSTKFFYSTTEGALTLTTQSATAGDYLVIEVGFYEATTVARNISLRYGDAGGSDFVYTVGLTTDLNPWIEFSANITLQAVNYVLQTTIGTFAWARNDGLVSQGRKILNTIGAFNLTENDAKLLANRQVRITTGAFAWTRNNAILTYVGFNHYELWTTIGTFDLTRNDVKLLRSYRILGTAGAFDWNRQNGFSLYNRLTKTVTGAFTWTRNDIIELYNRKLFSTTGSFTWTRNNVFELYKRLMKITTGEFIWTRNNAILTYFQGFQNYLLQTTIGVFALAGQPGNLLLNRLVKGSTGSFSFASDGEKLLYNQMLLAATGQYVFTAMDAIMTLGSMLEIYGALWVRDRAKHLAIGSDLVTMTATGSDHGE